MTTFEFKVWFRHKTRDVTILTRAELALGASTDVAMAACVAALAEVVTHPDDWEVWA